MKLTRSEIVLLVALVSAFVLGGFVHRYRALHPELAEPTPVISKKITRSKSSH